MAKKKAAHQAKESNREVRKQPYQNDDQQSATTVDDPAEKLQSLKSLNSLLVKETIDRRQQVESLVSAKEALETELTRYGKEKEGFIADLTKTSELIVGLDLEKRMVCAFFEAQMVQMSAEFNGLGKEKDDIERVKSERDVEIGFLKRKVDNLEGNLETERDQLRRVCQERDIVKGDYDNLLEKANKLRMEVIEIEKRERKVVEEVDKLIMQTNGLVTEKAEEKASDVATGEKELIEKSWEKSTKVIEDLKIAIEGIVREKNDIEHEKIGCEEKINDLEKEIGQLNGIVSSLRKENEMLLANVLQLEKSVGEAAKKEKFAAMEIDALLEDQKVKGNSIRKLEEQNDILGKSLELASKESEGMLQKIDIIIREKSEIEDIKVKKEGEIVEMQKELDELKTDVNMLRESCRIEKEKNAQLILEASHCKDVLDTIMHEKDEAQKSFRDEKKNVQDLRMVVLQMETKIEVTMTQLNQINRAQADLLQNKVEMEQQIENLMKDKALAEMNLTEAQRDIDDLSSRVKLATVNSERALVLLKETAVVMGQDKNGKDCEELDLKELNHEEQTQSYVAELNVIRDAFRKKQKMLKEMKQQLESVQSMSKASKRKNFWAMLTTAITILAAASAAYIAKRR